MNLFRYRRTGRPATYRAERPNLVEQQRASVGGFDKLDPEIQALQLERWREQQEAYFEQSDLHELQPSVAAVAEITTYLRHLQGDRDNAVEAQVAAIIGVLAEWSVSDARREVGVRKHKDGRPNYNEPVTALQELVEAAGLGGYGALARRLTVKLDGAPSKAKDQTTANYTVSKDGERVDRELVMHVLNLAGVDTAYKHQTI